MKSILVALTLATLSFGAFAGTPISCFKLDSSVKDQTAPALNLKSIRVSLLNNDDQISMRTVIKTKTKIKGHDSFDIELDCDGDSAESSCDHGNSARDILVLKENGLGATLVVSKATTFWSMDESQVSPSMTIVDGVKIALKAVPVAECE